MQDDSISTPIKPKFSDLTPEQVNVLMAIGMWISIIGSSVLFVYIMIRLWIVAINSI